MSTPSKMTVTLPTMYPKVDPPMIIASIASIRSLMMSQSNALVSAASASASPAFANDDDDGDTRDHRQHRQQPLADSEDAYTCERLCICMSSCYHTCECVMTDSVTHLSLMGRMSP